MPNCRWCRKPFNPTPRGGEEQRYCHPDCRKAWHREKTAFMDALEADAVGVVRDWSVGRDALTAPSMAGE